MEKASSTGLRARLSAGESLVGSYVTIASPEVVEILAFAGLDYVVIDLQHSSPNWDTLAHMLRAADVHRVSTIVRVHDKRPEFLLKVLELGAEGISLPGVTSAAELRAAADAVYYPPLGHRGACPHTRIAGFNPNRAEFPAHAARQNERVFLWALLEDPAAVAAVGAIAAVQPGASVIGVGRGDLSTVLGLAGQIDHPDVVAATERVIAEVRARSGGACVSSVMVHDEAEARRWFAAGARMFTYAADAVMLAKAARGAVSAFRAATLG